MTEEKSPPFGFAQGRLSGKRREKWGTQVFYRLEFGVCRPLRMGSRLGWLKTTTSAEVGHEGCNLCAVSDLLAFYSIENTKLRSLSIVRLWHGSCFSS